MLRQFPPNRFLRHLLFWSGVLPFFFIGFYSQPEVYSSDFDPMPLLRDLFFASLISFLFYSYTLVYGVLPLALQRSYGWFAICLLSLNIVASMLYDTLGHMRPFILHWLGHGSSSPAETLTFSNPFLGPFIFESNLVAGVIVGIKLFNRWHQKNQESQRLEREKLKTELQLLKLQLNPDFLFGSLNTLHHLTQQRAKLAPEIVLKLAHFLRYVLYESRANVVLLAWEAELIEQYVFLQKAIHSTDLDVSLTIRGRINNQTIVPLLLFSVIEKAFSHLPTKQGDLRTSEMAWVSIDLAVSETRLILKVVSELNGSLKNENTTNVNLDGLRKQLPAYYPDSHQLEIWQEDQINVVTLTITFSTTSLVPGAYPVDTAA